MTKIVRVKMKDAEGPLTYSSITTIDTAKQRLKLYEGLELVADFDKADITSWYELPTSG